jgi:hypothetical protein
MVRVARRTDAVAVSRKTDGSYTMTRRIQILALTVLLAGLLPLVAEADRVKTVQPGPEAARIVGSPGAPPKDLFAVKFIEINGQNIPPRDVMWLEPGTYRITVLIEAAITRPRQYRSFGDEPGYNIIELELEAGKTYHIRGRYHRNDPDKQGPYSVILHKVEE